MTLRPPLSDHQQYEVTAYCSRCHGEIYADPEDIAYVDGEPVCLDCLWEDDWL